MSKLTRLETEMLRAFIQEGIDCIGAENAIELLEDNMTWANSNDLVSVLGWSKHQVAGTMSALQEKGLIVDSGESPRGAKQNDWFVTDEAIRIASELGW